MTCTCRRTEEGILLAGPKQQKDAIAAGIDDFLPGQSGRHHHHKVRPARLKKCSNKFLKIVQYVRKNQRKFFFFLSIVEKKNLFFAFEVIVQHAFAQNFFKNCTIFPLLESTMALT